MAKYILADRGFVRACEKHELRLAHLLAVPSMMCPVAAAESWHIPAIGTAGELADWLGVTGGELEWFADLRSLEYKKNQGRLRHYHYRILSKRFGQVRLIEAPKPRLKNIQRRILADILDHIPLHTAVHGFRRGRSIKTFAAPHVGQQIVLKIDLQDFFPSIRVARVRAIFRAVGYPEQVADLLAGLCTNATPMDVWEHEALQLTKLAGASNPLAVLTAASSAGRTNLPGAGEPLCLSVGLPALRSGRLRRRDLHTICGRSGIFG